MFLLLPVALVLAVFGATDTEARPRATHDPIVRLAPRATDEDKFPTSYDAIDTLEAGTVLRVRVVGFDSFAEGVAAQCVTRARGFDCGNAFPVQFDGDGKAFFQYQLRDDFIAQTTPSRRCRAGAARCILAVRDVANDTTAVVDTVFHDAVPPPGTIRVHPSSGIIEGQSVTVTVTGYPAGAHVSAMLCVAPDATGSQRCGAPGPSAPLIVGPDGRGTTELVIEQGPVGSQHASCGRDATCGISVASDDVFARAPVVPISFAGPVGAEYDRNRLVLGVGLALLLLGLATWLIRRTDWSPPDEAAAPEIDEAEYADLDAIVAALPPEEDDALAPSR